ncbi:MAG: hypothetical protein ACTSRL_06505, partial [Candidatus Helarchaeota archaeon]
MKLKKYELIIVILFIGLLIFSIFGLLFINPRLSTRAIDSGWKTNDVVIDGKFTYDNEWEDASK